MKLVSAMKEILGETESLCPDCLNRILARRVSENGNVYLEKSCPEHGTYKALMWRGDAQSYLDWNRNSSEASPPLRNVTEVERGCPYDCGLCHDHKANTCTAVMEVIQGCNLRCPVCFASAGKSPNYEPTHESIKEMYQTVLKTVGTPAIQLSGGEPTLREDLPQLISLGRQMGFEHIMVNTNGIRIAKDKEYLRRLVDSGAGTIYLQFDGVTDEVYRYTRGMNLFQYKVEAIRNCSEAKIGVILVPTLILDINDQEIGDIIQFAKQWIPTIKGVHFQPITYFGRYPKVPRDDRITIPDVIHALVEQTEGELKEEDFLPRRSEDSHCSFGSLFSLRKGRLSPITNRRFIEKGGKEGKPPWEAARSFMKLHWRYSEREGNYVSCGCGMELASELSPQDDFLKWVTTYGFTITGMPFQDAWNIDLERLKRCCTHVATADKRIIPLCAYYLTSSYGKRLYGSVVRE